MTIHDIRRLEAEVREFRTEARAILDRCGNADLTGADAERFDTLTTTIEGHNAEITQLNNRHDREIALIRSAGTPGSHLMREDEGSGVDPYGRDEDREPQHPQRDSAMRVLERATKDDRLNARGAELVENLMRTGTAMSQTWTQRWATAAGSPAYERAFAKKLTSPEGHLLWTTEEADAWRSVAAVASEQRAMSLTDTAGGFLIPAFLDPAIQISNAGSINPIREISRVVQVVGDAWSGVTSAGVTAEWLAEATQAADASPTLAQPTIPNYKASAFVPFSYEVGDDGMNFLPELTKLLLDGYEQLCATAFTTGSGVGQPTGIITALAGGSSVVTPTTPETFAAADVYKVHAAVPPRFQPNTSWLAGLPVLHLIRQMETTNGSLKFPELSLNPPMLLNRRVFENSNMDATFDPAATATNLILLAGDFSQYCITDRIGSRIELIPNLMGDNNRPTGQRGAFLWARVGADSLIDNAFRVLNIATAA